MSSCVVPVLKNRDWHEDVSMLTRVSSCGPGHRPLFEILHYHLRRHRRKQDIEKYETMSRFDIHYCQCVERYGQWQIVVGHGGSDRPAKILKKTICPFIILHRLPLKLSDTTAYVHNITTHESDSATPKVKSWRVHDSFATPYPTPSVSEDAAPTPPRNPSSVKIGRIDDVSSAMNDGWCREVERGVPKGRGRGMRVLVIH
mmetsp:Transcript_61324/g.72833  ORF Transcript_61324/g.72833 Transcript_61324/m.72833 type:complete len:201 (-) Transcript_61324:158-760(-)